ncbi:MAG: B12-binding domain-containing radical SAM protein [Campylobacterales bacterium]|nr:B12-binding domain-containing radical SAM protein [Campylobacterales bacterium]
MIILTTLNGRYTHSAIGLRYLYANMKELQKDTKILEFVINENPGDIVEKILANSPKIVGIGAYIWNAIDVKNIMDLIKKISPETTIVLGGPEASYQPFRVDFSSADYIIQGEGDLAFYKICKEILDGKKPEKRIFLPQMVDLNEIELPYKYYTDHDVEHRYTYVEASRGCPFSCEFCLSSIDKKVRNLDLDKFLSELETLWNRGVRNFKFIDRTFNLNIKSSIRLLDFFLEKEPPYLVHFEVIPDNFPEKLKEKIKLFPPASLQLEIGIQTLNPKIAKNINRNLKIEKIKENIKFIEEETNAHIHLDLIVGLPEETLESFGENLDLLKSISKSEIQIGILKKLSGTTLSRHDEEFGMVYSDRPPYDILKNNLISFEKMQEMKRFARFWDMVYNKGNFNKTVNLIWDNGKVYKGFLEFSKWLYGETASTWQISLDRLSKLIFKYLTEIKEMNKTEVADIMLEDILKISGRKVPRFLKEFASYIPDLDKTEAKGLNKRQLKHL